jgi:hypothetical protein
MTLERVDLLELIELADRPEVKSIMPGLGRDERLRGLSECLWLRDRDGADIAVMQPKWLGQWTAVIFPVPEEDSEFCWEVLAWMFDTMKADASSLRFASNTDDAGHRYRASYVGQGTPFSGGFHHWELTRLEWLKAVAARQPVSEEEAAA